MFRLNFQLLLHLFRIYYIIRLYIMCCSGFFILVDAINGFSDTHEFEFIYRSLIDILMKLHSFDVLSQVADVKDAILD